MADTAELERRSGGGGARRRSGRCHGGDRRLRLRDVPRPHRSEPWRGAATRRPNRPVRPPSRSLPVDWPASATARRPASAAAGVRDGAVRRRPRRHPHWRGAGGASRQKWRGAGWGRGRAGRRREAVERDADEPDDELIPLTILQRGADLLNVGAAPRGIVETTRASACPGPSGVSGRDPAACLLHVVDGLV